MSNGTGTVRCDVTFEVPGYASMTAAMRLRTHAGEIQQRQPVTEPVPFTIYRQPVKTAATPIELPNNVALDLSVSGYAHYGDLSDSLTSFRRLLHWENSTENGYNRTLSPEHDIVMMFSPDGGLDNVYYVSHEHEGTFAEKPLGNVSLLVVRDDKIGKDLSGQSNIVVPPVTPDTFEDPKKYLGFQQQFYQDNIMGPLGEGSLADKTAIWVTVSGHSGRVYSAPNRGLDTGMNISATDWTRGSLWRWRVRWPIRGRAWVGVECDCGKRQRCEADVRSDRDTGDECETARGHRGAASYDPATAPGDQPVGDHDLHRHRGDRLDWRRGADSAGPPQSGTGSPGRSQGAVRQACFS